jgi:hypothetical protein
MTSFASDEGRPSWLRDGRWIYFGSNRSGDWQVWKMHAAGGDAVQVTKRSMWPKLSSTAPSTARTGSRQRREVSQVNWICSGEYENAKAPCELSFRFCASKLLREVTGV